MVFDPTTGSLALDGAPTEAVSPSFLAFNHDGSRLFAVERDGHQDGRAGRRPSFAVDRATGAPALLSRTSSAGAAPCHLSLDNAEAGTCWSRTTGAARSPLPGPGRRPARERLLVRAAHRREPDAARPGPTRTRSRWTRRTAGRWWRTSGLDKLFVYPLDAVRGALGAAREVPAEKGAGPRHFVFDPDGRGVFVLNELNGTVISSRSTR